MNNDGERCIPVNGINPPRPPLIAGDAAGARQLYAAGIFGLEDDEAILIEVDMNEASYYMGFHLSNGWFESLDQANHLSSRNHEQLEFHGNGKKTYLMA